MGKESAQGKFGTLLSRVSAILHPMATRYSGDLTVTCTYQDRGDYKCTVSPKGKRGKTIYVGAPAAGFGRGISYDSPEAYDSTAHAAISFALDEGLDGEPEYGLGGYIVQRKPYAHKKKGGGGAIMSNGLPYFAANHSGWNSFSSGVGGGARHRRAGGGANMVGPNMPYYATSGVGRPGGGGGGAKTWQSTSMGSYVVYKDCTHKTPLKEFSWQEYGKKALDEAKKFAKSLPYWGAGVYSVSRGGFDGWINQKGNFISFLRRG
jgi:hypothetical protein